MENKISEYEKRLCLASMPDWAKKSMIINDSGGELDHYVSKIISTLTLARLLGFSEDAERFLRDGYIDSKDATPGLIYSYEYGAINLLDEITKKARDKIKRDLHKVPALFKAVDVTIVPSSTRPKVIIFPMFDKLQQLGKEDLETFKTNFTQLFCIYSSVMSTHTFKISGVEFVVLQDVLDKLLAMKAKSTKSTLPNTPSTLSADNILELTAPLRLAQQERLWKNCGILKDCRIKKDKIEKDVFCVKTKEQGGTDALYFFQMKKHLSGGGTYIQFKENGQFHNIVKKLKYYNPVRFQSIYSEFFGEYMVSGVRLVGRAFGDTITNLDLSSVDVVEVDSFEPSMLSGDVFLVSTTGGYKRLFRLDDVRNKNYTFNIEKHFYQPSEVSQDDIEVDKSSQLYKSLVAMFGNGNEALIKELYILNKEKEGIHE